MPSVCRVCGLEVARSGSVDSSSALTWWTPASSLAFLRPFVPPARGSLRHAVFVPLPLHVLRAA
ncbi:hypothetical protein SKAU_G00158150 [Synaphobranchus kaupii]|uniref:Uncharacterized protein n=1 Tax=Synaphobranchus kaupii TaxID=118154 RepID=A0A9Q1FHZ5_SYNKA|nr:hypothetical protein SKAU_G00158150 [Synaphobranchus kaupii]